MRLLLTIMGSMLALPIAVALYFVSRTARDPQRARFAEGHVPDPPPDGAYRGAVPGYERLAWFWHGKRFDAAAGTGVNLVGDAAHVREACPFRTYVASRMDQQEGHVLRVDYDIPENPFWLRRCADELVELEPGRYLGKAFIRLIPGHPFGMLFFELRAQHDG